MAEHYSHAVFRLCEALDAFVIAHRRHHEVRARWLAAQAYAWRQVANKIYSPSNLEAEDNYQIHQFHAAEITDQIATKQKEIEQLRKELEAVESSSV